MSYNNIIANQPLVIDNGSGVIKAGFAGEQTPKCRFPNFVGRPKHTRVMAGALEGDTFVGMLFYIKLLTLILNKNFNFFFKFNKKICFFRAKSRKISWFIIT